MGVGFSQPGSLAKIDHHWVLENDAQFKFTNSVSLESVKKGEDRVLLAAYLASAASYEGSPGQHIRLATSKDGGETWGKSKAVQWGLGPLWGPALYYHKDTSKLILFYSESRKAYSPGGDIKLITSNDLGETWTAPLTVLTHEADGEVPKVTANKPLISKDGTWYLPFHREPADSYKVFNAKTFNGMKASEKELPKLVTPPGAVEQGNTTSAGVLVSIDKGTTWIARGEVELPKTWLIEPAIEETSKGKLVMFFRTAAGRVYSSQSGDDGKTWSKPGYTSLANPNSKFATLTIEGQILAVYNSSATTRAPLTLALSIDDGRSWEVLAAIEDDKDGNFSYPSIVEWSEDTVKVAYTVWGKGIRLASIKLAVVES